MPIVELITTMLSSPVPWQRALAELRDGEAQGMPFIDPEAYT